mgnify:CR=1 FL=1
MCIRDSSDTIENQQFLADTGRKNAVKKATVSTQVIEKRNGKTKSTNPKHAKYKAVMKPVLDTSFFMGNTVDIKLFSLLNMAFNKALNRFPLGSEMEFIRTIPIVLNFHFGRFPNQGYRRVLKATRTNTQRDFALIKQSFSESNELDMIAKIEIESLENELDKHKGLHSIEDVLEFLSLIHISEPTRPY